MKREDRPVDEEVAETIEGLLAIIEVAMPSELFAVDPRVVKAQALLAKLRGEIQ